MPGTFTPESLAKAAATRKANAAIRKQAAQDKRDGVTRVLDTVKDRTNSKGISDPPLIGTITAVPSAQTMAAPTVFTGMHFPPRNDFDWATAPLPDCLAALGDLRREYDRIAAIVLSRQSAHQSRRTCWTQLHKDLVPASIRALCRKTMEDGKWASRDDAVFKIVDGIKVPDPVFCCNSYCHEQYLRSKQPSAQVRQP